jgi:hypothetical protein
VQLLGPVKCEDDRVGVDRLSVMKLKSLPYPYDPIERVYVLDGLSDCRHNFAVVIEAEEAFVDREDGVSIRLREHRIEAHRLCVQENDSRPLGRLSMCKAEGACPEP